MTVTLYHIYITYNINCHDGIVIYFIKTFEFIIKLARTLFMLKIISLRLILFIYVFLHHYKYLHGLVALREDAIGVDLGDCT
jgi:hypothetical protein